MPQTSFPLKLDIKDNSDNISIFGFVSFWFRLVLFALVSISFCILQVRKLSGNGLRTHNYLLTKLFIFFFDGTPLLSPVTIHNS